MMASKMIDKLKPILVVWLILFDLLVQTYGQTPLSQVTVAVPSSSKVLASADQQITLTFSSPPSSSIPAGSILLIRITPLSYFYFSTTPPTLNTVRYTIGSQSQITASVANVVGTLSASYYEIKVLNIAYSFTSTDTTMQIIFTMQNARCNCKASFQAIIESPTSTPLYSGTGSFTYTPETSTCSSATVSDPTTGKRGLTATFTFQPKYAISIGSSISFKFTSWFSDISEGVFYDFQDYTSPSAVSCGYTALAGQSSLYNSGFQCALSSSDSSISFNTINQAVFPVNTYQLSLAQFRNPFSTQAYSFSLWISEQVSAGVLQLKESCTYSLTASTPVTFSFLSTSPSSPSTALSAVQTITFTATANTPFDIAGTFLRVIYNSPLVITYPSNGATGSVVGSNMQLDIPSFITATIGTGTQYSFSLQIQSPSYAATSSINFQIMYKNPSNGNVYQQEQITSQYQIITNPGTLTASITTIANPVINAVTSYTFQITLNTSYSAGSVLYFKFPSTSFTLSSPTCSWVSGSSINSALSCTSLSSNEIQSTNIFNNALTSGYTFSIKVSGIQNPSTTSYSDYIIIQTRTSTSNIIEQNATLRVQAQPMLLTASIASMSSYVVYSTTTITFNITPALLIPANGIIQITFPTDLTYSTNPTITNLVNLGATTIQGTYPNLQIITTNALPASTQISFTLTGITNPTSFKQTNSFVIQTIDASSNVIQQISTGLTVQMNTMATTTNVSITATSAYTGVTNVNYTFQITLAVPQTGTNVYTITFPSQIAINNSATCTAVVGIASLTCTQSTNVIKATVTYGTFPANSIVSIIISSANNYIVSGTYPFSFTSVTSDGYAIEGLPTINYVLQSSLLTASGTNTQTVMTKTDNIYTLTITPKLALTSGLSSSNTSIIITLPTQVSIMGNTICQITSPTSLTCAQNVASKTFTCSPAGSFTQPITITMTNLGFNYIATGQSDSLSVSTDYNSVPIEQTSSGISLVHNCNPNCYQCSTTTSTCTSCFSSTLTTNSLLQSNKCQSTCSSGYVALTGNTVCQPCLNNCATCTTDQTTCASCTGIYYLSGTNCVTNCPSGYFANTLTNQCQACISPCATCSGSSSYCTTCLNNATNSVNIYAYQGNCVSSCPAYTTILVNTQCLPCANNCSQCQTDINTCLVCNTGYYLSGTVCVTSCPASTYPLSGKCQTCYSPCSTCSGGPTYCTGCIAPYYSYNGTCVNSPCPSGTFQTDSNRSCTSCPKGCLACTSLTNCTVCDASSGYTVLYNNQCLTSCPQDKPFKSSNGCESCDSTCLTCVNSVDYCSSCNSNLYLYNGKCLSSCPSGFVGNSSTNSCVNPQTKETRIYFPYLIGTCIFLGITAASKIMVKTSQFFTNATAFSSIFEFLSWLTTGLLMFNYNSNYNDNTIQTALGVYWVGFFIYVLTNILSFIYIKKKFLTDIRFSTWRLQSKGNSHSTNFIQVFTLIFSFKFFRFIYGRFLNRTYLSARFIDNDVVFKPTNFLSILSYIFSSILIIAGAAVACYETQIIEDNLYYFSIETIILTLIMLFLVMGDIFKEKDYFSHDLHVDKKSRVYIDDGTAKQDPYMSMDARNEMEKNVLEKSLAYDRLNNSNTNALLQQRSKNNQQSIQELEAGDLNESSLYNSILNSQHRIKKVQNGVIAEEDGDESNRFKKNGAGIESSKMKSTNKNTILSPSNTDRQGGMSNANKDKNKRANSSENITSSKIFSSQATQTLLAQGSPRKSQSSIKEKGSQKNKQNSQSPDKNEKNGVQASSRSPANLNKSQKGFDQSKKLNNNEDGDQILNGKDCHHLIRVYEKNGAQNGEKQNLNSTNNMSPKSQNKSKSPSKSPKKKVAGGASPKKNGTKSKVGKDKDGKNAKNQSLIGLDDEEVESAYNPTDGGRQFNGIKNLKTNDSKDINSNNSGSNNNNNNNNNSHNNNNGNGNGNFKTPSRQKSILDDASGQYHNADSDEENVIQDTPSNYNYLNMRFESKDLLNMQSASTGMKTLHGGNTSPMNYGAPSPLDPGYSTTTSVPQYGSGIKPPLQNQFFQSESPNKLQAPPLRKSGNSSINGERNGPKKSLSITPQNYTYSRNSSPTKNGNGYSITPTSNTFAANGQNIMKTHSDYDEGIKISKILEQESSKNQKMGAQPFFMTQKLTQSDKQKQDYLDNYDYSVPHTQNNEKNNYQNEFITEQSKGRGDPNNKSKMKSKSRNLKTLDSDPKVKQLEDIYNQKLIPPQSNSRQFSNQQSQPSSVRGNKKIAGLTIADPANFSDYENDGNHGYY